MCGKSYSGRWPIIVLLYAIYFSIIFAKRNELICMELNCAIQVDTDADFERLLNIYK